MTCLGVVTARPRAGLFSFASMEHNLPMLARAIAVLLFLVPIAGRRQHRRGPPFDILAHYAHPREAPPPRCSVAVMWATGRDESAPKPRQLVTYTKGP